MHYFECTFHEAVHKRAGRALLYAGCPFMGEHFSSALTVSGAPGVLFGATVAFGVSVLRSLLFIPRSQHGGVQNYPS